MSSNIGISASTAGNDESTPDPTRKCMSKLTHSPPDDENNVHDEELAQAIVVSLIADQVAIILGFLKHNEIMYARVCTTWRDAAKKTLVPLSDFQVKDVRSYNALRVMATAIPNIQQLSISDLGDRNKYADGEDPIEKVAADTANLTAHDLNIISHFRKLRILQVQYSFRALNGRYPVLFNFFPLLQNLKISCCPYLKWDLEMLSECPLLRELGLIHLDRKSTGNLSSLRVMKNTLVKVHIHNCCNIRGNVMELADFPCLKELWICECPVTGDIRHIQEDNFPSLEKLLLPSTVIGGDEYQFQRISDVPSFMHAIHHLLKRFPKLFNHCRWMLSRDSADFYEYEIDSGSRPPEPPFYIRFVLPGLRLGWRWRSFNFRHACEVNWLDPEPSKDSDDYDEYVQRLQKMKKIEDETEFYRGYHEPPTEQEYRRLCLRDRED